MKRCVHCGAEFDNRGWTCPVCGVTPELVDGIPLFAPELAIEGIGYDSDWFDALVEVEDQNWWFRSRNRLILETLRRVFPRAGSVLEIGCGTGFVLRDLVRAGYEVTGSELFPRGIEHARRRASEATFVQLDARSLPYRGAFDVVAALDVIEHVADDESVLSEMAAAVRPGGGVMITVPQHRWLWSKADDFAHHERRYTRRDLVTKLERAGLEPAVVTSFVTIALPAMFVARMVEQRSDTYDPMSEFAIPPLLNRALEQLASVERMLIRAGVSLPAGGSLLVAARRR